MGWRRDIKCSASQASTMEPYSRRGQRKNRFWSMPQTSTFQTLLIIICSMFCLSTKEDGGLLREFHGLYQGRTATSISSFSAFLRNAPSANNTTTATLEKLLLNTTRLYELDLCNITERWRGCNQRRQQSLVWFVETFLSSAASASIVGLVNGQKIIPTTHLLQKRTNHVSDLPNKTESVTVSLNEGKILLEK